MYRQHTDTQTHRQGLRRVSTPHTPFRLTHRFASHRFSFNSKNAIPGIPPYSYGKKTHRHTDRQALRGVSTPHTPFRLTHRFASHTVSPHTVSPHTPFRLTHRFALHRFSLNSKKCDSRNSTLFVWYKNPHTDTHTDTQTD